MSMGKTCEEHATPQKITLALAYEATLGGVMAISPDMYAGALEHMARLTGRVVDDAFRKEVDAVGRLMTCDLD